MVTQADSCSCHYDSVVMDDIPGGPTLELAVLPVLITIKLALLICHCNGLLQDDPWPAMQAAPVEVTKWKTLRLSHATKRA